MRKEAKIILKSSKKDQLFQKQIKWTKSVGN